MDGNNPEIGKQGVFLPCLVSLWELLVCPVTFCSVQCPTYVRNRPERWITWIPQRSHPPKRCYTQQDRMKYFTNQVSKFCGKYIRYCQDIWNCSQISLFNSSGPQDSGWHSGQPLFHLLPSVYLVRWVSLFVLECPLYTPCCWWCCCPRALLSFLGIHHRWGEKWLEWMRSQHSGRHGIERIKVDIVEWSTVKGIQRRDGLTFSNQHSMRGLTELFPIKVNQLQDVPL